MKSLLIIGMGFYDYEKEIYRSANEHFLNVNLVNSKPKFLDLPLISNFFNFFNFIQQKIISIHQSGILKRIKKNQYSKILVINGSELDRTFLKDIKIFSPETKVYLYLWDSVRRLNIDTHIFDHFNLIFSFDSDDCKLYRNFVYRPLFFIGKHAKRIPYQERKYDISFISVLNPKRGLFLESLVKFISNNPHLKSRIFLLGGIKDVVKSLLIYKKFYVFPYSLNARQYYEIINNSKCLIDVGHDLQSGLSMRCIEAIGSSCKILTTNQAIQNYDFYDHRFVRVLSPEVLEAHKGFLLSSDEAHYERFKNYSISSWVSDILVSR